MKTTTKIDPPLQIFFAPSPSLKKLPEIFLTMTATPQPILNRKWYQASRPEMEFHMINIIYTALPMCAQTEKNNIFMQRRLYIDEAHTALDIFLFAVSLCFGNKASSNRFVSLLVCFNTNFKKVWGQWLGNCTNYKGLVARLLPRQL